MQLARALLFAALFSFSRFRRGIAAADRIAMKDLSRSTAALAFLCAGFPLVQPAAAQTAQTMPAWPDTFLARVEALALVETLNATLLAARSATFTLDKWCADHKLAGETKIHARLIRGVDKPIADEQRRRLQVDQNEPVKFRHVELACGDRVLSEADNWYVPSRLTAEMNRSLETTDTPFGRDRGAKALSPNLRRRGGVEAARGRLGTAAADRRSSATGAGDTAQALWASSACLHVPISSR